MGTISTSLLYKSNHLDIILKEFTILLQISVATETLSFSFIVPQSRKFSRMHQVFGKCLIIYDNY